MALPEPTPSWLVELLNTQRKAVAEEISKLLEKRLDERNQIMFDMFSSCSNAVEPCEIARGTEAPESTVVVDGLEGAEQGRAELPSPPAAEKHCEGKLQKQMSVDSSILTRRPWYQRIFPLTEDEAFEQTLRDMKKRQRSKIASKSKEHLLSDRDLHDHDANKNNNYKKLQTYTSQVLRDMSGQDELLGHGCLHKLVAGKPFELVTGFLIFSCVFTMALEIQYRGFDSGFELEVSGYSVPGSEMWPGFVDAMDVLEVFYCTAFTLELILRFLAMGLRVLKSGWTCLDLMLVLAGWFDVVGMSSFGGIDPMMLRVARLVRMARLLRVFKAMKMLDTLWILVRSVQASLGALFWSFLFMLFVHFATAILLCQLLSSFLTDVSQDEDDRRKVFKYFGTFSSAMFSMFEIALGNWVVPARLLMSAISEGWGLFFVLYRGCFMFAVVKVITAVFIAETTKCLANDDSISIVHTQRSREHYCHKLADIFRELDESGDGVLDREEFEHLIEDDLLRSWLATLSIDTRDLNELFLILDQGDFMIDIAEFTRGMTRVKGPAKSIDVLKLQTAAKNLEGMSRNLEAKLDSLIMKCGTSRATLPDSLAVSHPSVTDVAFSDVLKTTMDNNAKLNQLIEHCVTHSCSLRL